MNRLLLITVFSITSATAQVAEVKVNPNTGTLIAPTASTFRSANGLAIGSNVQAYDADLTTWAGITPSANVQTLLGSANYAAFRTALSLVVGTNVQAYDADLSLLAAVTPTTKGDLLAFTGSAWNRLPVGTDGQVIAADSGEATGLKWVEQSGGGEPAFSEGGTYFFDGSQPDDSGDGSRNRPWKTAAPLLAAILPLSGPAELSLDIASGTNIGSLDFGGQFDVTLYVRGRDSTSVIGNITNTAGLTVGVTVVGNGKGRTTVGNIDTSGAAAGVSGGSVILTGVSAGNIAAYGMSGSAQAGGDGGSVTLSDATAGTINIAGGDGTSEDPGGSGGGLTILSGVSHGAVSQGGGGDNGGGAGSAGAVNRFYLNGFTTLIMPASGTVASAGGKLSQFATTTSAELAGVLSDETGDGGGIVRANNATLSAPVIDNQTDGLSAVSPTSGAIAISLTGPKVRTLALSGNPMFTTTNRPSAAARTVSILVTVDGSNRTPTWGTGWLWAGTKPTTLTASTSYWFTITATGSTEASVVAAIAPLAP